MDVTVVSHHRISGKVMNALELMIFHIINGGFALTVRGYTGSVGVPTHNGMITVFHEDTKGQANI